MAGGSPYNARSLSGVCPGLRAWLGPSARVVRGKWRIQDAPSQQVADGSPGGTTQAPGPASSLPLEATARFKRRECNFPGRVQTCNGTDVPTAIDYQRAGQHVRDNCLQTSSYRPRACSPGTHTEHSWLAGLGTQRLEIGMQDLQGLPLSLAGN